LSGGFVVANDGSVAHPLYQDVHVASVPLPEVRERLRTFILAFERNPQIVVQPLFRVAVGGEVRTPNVYLLPPEATVAGAVAMAGGITERGKSSVALQRQGRRITVDLNNPRAGGDTMTVRSGDRIIVERRANLLGILSPLASLTAIAASILVITRQ
jgi:protein involved in polysaccharide export with SLBB domain